MKRLTKSQYEQIAYMICWRVEKAENADQRVSLRKLANDMADRFLQEDSEFKRYEFKKLCGITD